MYYIKDYNIHNNFPYLLMVTGHFANVHFANTHFANTVLPNPTLPTSCFTDRPFYQHAILLTCPFSQKDHFTNIPFC